MQLIFKGSVLIEYRFINDIVFEPSWNLLTKPTNIMKWNHISWNIAQRIIKNERVTENVWRNKKMQ